MARTTPDLPQMTKSQRKLLYRVLDWPAQTGRLYRPRGRFTKLIAQRLVDKGVLEPLDGEEPPAYRSLVGDPR